MTTEAPAQVKLNAETLYPLLLRAQELGAPIEVAKPDVDGDVYLKVFDGTAEDLFNDFVYKNRELDKRPQYLIMGVLMDWLSTLQTEVGCMRCPETQQAMGRAWTTGGFVAMLEAFNTKVKEFSIVNCIQNLKAKREQEAEEAKVTVTLTAEGERIKELEADLGRVTTERDQALDKLQRVREVLLPLRSIQVPEGGLGILSAGLRIER